MTGEANRGRKTCCQKTKNKTWPKKSLTIQTTIPWLDSWGLKKTKNKYCHKQSCVHHYSYITDYLGPICKSEKHKGPAGKPQEETTLAL